MLSEIRFERVFQRGNAVCAVVALALAIGCGGGTTAPSANLSSAPSNAANPGAASGGASNTGGSSSGTTSTGGSSTPSGSGGSGTSGGSGPTPGGGSSTGALLYVGMDDTYGTTYGAILPQTGHAAVAGFSIASDGSLQSTPGSAYSGPAALLAGNPSASTLYAASGSNVNVDRINGDGSLTATATLTAQPLSPSIGIYWDLSLDVAGQLLYALAAHGSGTNFWEIYKSGGDGSLSAAESIATGPAAAHLYFTPDGKRAYSPECYHLDGAIWGYTVGGDDKLTAFDTKAQVSTFGSSFPACPFALSISSDGTRLATQLNPKTGNGAGIGVYNINGDGTLTQQSGSPLTTTAQGSDISWDPFGRHIAVGAKDGLWIYSAATGSAPAPAGGAPIITGPMDHVAFNKTGTLLFAVNASAQNVYVFSFNSTTGLTTPAPGSPHKMNLAPYQLAVVEK
jgi:hypothetical protein